MNTPVSFELAKLLKEKGFNNECSFFYSVMEGEEGKLLPVTSSLEHVMEYSKKGYKFFDESTDKTLIHQTLRNDYAKGTVTAPTIAEVVMWIYNKHGIWVISKKVNGLNKWFAQIYKNNANDLCDTNIINISPTEAYTAAIEYTLKELI